MKKIRRENIIFWIVITIGIIIRIYKFPLALQEMNCDEIMTAVNAISIADKGKEIGGISFPVYLQGWGGQSVVLLYLMALIIKIIGSSLFAVRLPLLIISIISLFVFYDLLKKMSKSKNIALIGLILVSISPWHILQSIWALDCNMFPHFLLFAIDLFYTGITKNKNVLLYFSMAFFAICLYCYGVSIYFIPLFLLLMAIYLLNTKRITVRQVVISIVIFIIIAIPIITMFALNVLKIENSIEIGNITIPYYENLSRTKDMVFFTPNVFEQLLKNITSTFKVIVIQNDGMEWNASKLFGTTYHITVLFSIIGFARCIRNIKKDKKCLTSFMLITWLCISILTGFVINQANINRLNSIWYVQLILGTIGMYTIYEKIKYKKIYKYSIIVLYSAIFISYITYLFGYYTNIVDNSGCFSRGFYQSLSYVNNLDKSIVLYDNIKNDGCLELYVDFNTNESKQYYAIKDENELKEKIKNIDDNQILILEIEFKQYENIKNSKQIGNFLIVTK